MTDLGAPVAGEEATGAPADRTEWLAAATRGGVMTRRHR